MTDARRIHSAPSAAVRIARNARPLGRFAPQLDCADVNGKARRLRRGSGVRFNRRDSKSRVPSWDRGFESPPLRHTVCIFYLHSEGGTKCARHVALLMPTGTGESMLSADSRDSGQIFSARRKFGSLGGTRSHALRTWALAPRSTDLEAQATARTLSCADQSSGRSIRLSSVSALRSPG